MRDEADIAQFAQRAFANVQSSTSRAGSRRFLRSTQFAVRAQNSLDGGSEMKERKDTRPQIGLLECYNHYWLANSENQVENAIGSEESRGNLYGKNDQSGQ